MEKYCVFYHFSLKKRPLVGSWHTEGVLKAGHGLMEAVVVVGTSSPQKRAWVEGKGQMRCLSGCDPSHSCAARRGWGPPSAVLCADVTRIWDLQGACTG